MAKDGRWTSARIRAALLEHREAVGGGGYPPELRDRAVRCARRLEARGLNVSAIAAELGIMASTATDWCGKAKVAKRTKDEGGTMSFVPVVVEGHERAQARQGQFEIAFPTGVVLRVEGVDHEAITAAIAALNARGQS